VVPLSSDFNSVQENGSPEDVELMNKLALFLSALLRTHLPLLEGALPNREQLRIAMLYLVRLSEVRDEDLFRTCLDFWHFFAADLYTQETRGSQWHGSGSAGSGSGGSSVALTGAGATSAAAAPPPGVRKAVYDDMQLLTGLRRLLISRMAKPEEVLIVEDPETGEIKREVSNSSTTVIATYKTMREALVYLTHLDVVNTERIMVEKLEGQVSNKGQHFTYNELNTLCWAIGSISGAMRELDEKRFLVGVIKDLLRLCDAVRGKDHKAVVASNIMYIVGQYPRFLRAHWRFLKTVVNKLFEFMHEKHPGVQDMACDTFLKISNKCKRKFVTVQVDEFQPYIITLVQELARHISDLEERQVYAFYEAVGTMLSDRGPAVAISAKEVLHMLMEIPNATWQAIAQRARDDVGTLFNVQVARDLSRCLKINTRVCMSARGVFVHQLSNIFMDMLNIYQLYSQQVSRAVEAEGPVAALHTMCKAMRAVKSDILDLLTAFLDKCEGPDVAPAEVMQTFLPPLLEQMLPEYKAAHPDARDYRVLALLAAAINSLAGSSRGGPGSTAVAQQVTAEVPRMMDSVFEATLSLITRNFTDKPDHRLHFFKFLRAANSKCFQGLFAVPSQHQGLIIDSIVWAFKHEDPVLSDTGLEILQELLQNMTRAPDVASGFYQRYLMVLIQDVLVIMTDRAHKAGFKMQTTVLRQLFHLVETGVVTVPLFDPSKHPPGLTNAQFAREQVTTMLVGAFSNLSRARVLEFVSVLFDVTMELNAFKTHVRDFLISVRFPRPLFAPGRRNRAQPAPSPPVHNAPREYNPPSPASSSTSSAARRTTSCSSSRTTSGCSRSRTN